MADPSPPKPAGWILPLVLLGIYLFLKLQGWNYEFRAMEMEKQLERLRPTLSAIVLSEQLEATKEELTQLLDKVENLALEPNPFLQQLSKNLPGEITLEKMEIGPEGIQVKGILRPEARSAGEVLALWTEKWEERWHPVQVQDLTQDLKTPEIWHFQLRTQKASNVS